MGNSSKAKTKIRYFFSQNRSNEPFSLLIRMLHFILDKWTCGGSSYSISHSFGCCCWCCVFYFNDVNRQSICSIINYTIFREQYQWYSNSNKWTNERQQQQQQQIICVTYESPYTYKHTQWKQSKSFYFALTALSVALRISIHFMTPSSYSTYECVCVRVCGEIHEKKKHINDMAIRNDSYEYLLRRVVYCSSAQKIES